MDMAEAITAIKQAREALQIYLPGAEKALQILNQANRVQAHTEQQLREVREQIAHSQAQLEDLNDQIQVEAARLAKLKGKIHALAASLSEDS
jgi:chromosome segregation ATPase